VPKILFLRADEIGLVQSSHLVWRTPELTLPNSRRGAGHWLACGSSSDWRSELPYSSRHRGCLILIALVASGNPSMLVDPYGALVKDLCLIACAITVWTLGRTQFAPG